MRTRPRMESHPYMARLMASGRRRGGNGRWLARRETTPYRIRLASFAMSMSPRARSGFSRGVLGPRVELNVHHTSQPGPVLPAHQFFFLDRLPRHPGLGRHRRGSPRHYGFSAHLACQLTSTLDGTPISSLQILTVRTQSPKFTTILPPERISTVPQGFARALCHRARPGA